MSDIAYKSNDIHEVRDFVKDWAEVHKGADYENLHVFDLKEDKLIYVAQFHVRDYFDKDARDLDVEMNEI